MALIRLVVRGVHCPGPSIPDRSRQRGYWSTPLAKRCRQLGPEHGDKLEENRPTAVRKEGCHAYGQPLAIAFDRAGCRLIFGERFHQCSLVPFCGGRVNGGPPPNRRVPAKESCACRSDCPPAELRHPTGEGPTAVTPNSRRGDGSCPRLMIHERRA